MATCGETNNENCGEDERENVGRYSAEDLEKIKNKWSSEQEEMKKQIILEDREGWQNRKTNDALKFVAGVDISFIKNDEVNACASVIVLELPTLKVVYKKCAMIRLTAPYIAGFLAFREAPHLTKLINRIPEDKKPQVILVDGNGVLHPRGFGLASHLGVQIDHPTIGVAKNLLNVDGLSRDDVLEKFAMTCSEKGDTMDLIGDSGVVHGKAYKSTPQSSKNAIFVSAGHKITLDTAIWVVNQCCKHRIPEPIRQADLTSRRHLRDLEQNGKLPTPATLCA